jgi:hypothetical protein
VVSYENDGLSFRRIWHGLTTLVTAVVTAWGISYWLAATYAGDGPVIRTSQFVLHTPQVQVGTALTFSLWRESFESCPGDVVMVYRSVDKNIDSVPDATNEVISIRYPLATPGYNSPPRLTITRQIPRQVSPGIWDVEVSIESRCPTRTRMDPTANFQLEVVPRAQVPS